MNIATDFTGTIIGYDGTPLAKIIDLIKQDIANGDTVLVITSSADKSVVKDFVNQHLDDLTIIYTKSVKDKINVLAAEKIDLYYNDDVDENKAIADELGIQVINVTADQSQERLDALDIPEKKYGDKTVLVYDTGLFFSIADRLSRDFGKVYYYVQWQSTFPKLNDSLVGTGFDNVERIYDFWNLLDEIDLFVFPDIFFSDIQIYLEKIGKRVWGSRKGDEMEIYRWEFIETMKELGMPVPPSELVIGIDNLRDRLKNLENKFIKVDGMIRGNIETFNHVNYDVTCPLLDKLAYTFGPKKNDIRFIIQDPIPTTAEIGYDGYTIDGQFPDTCLFGIEVKGEGYVGEMRQYKDVPKEIKTINDYLAPLFKKYGYRGMFSSEIRVGEDGLPYLIDPTCRFPSPPTAVMLELYDNISEIMYEGSAGILVQPVYSSKFGAEAIGTSDFVVNSFSELTYDIKDEMFIKTSNCCIVEDKMYIIPMDSTKVCHVVAVANDLDEAIEQLTERCSNIKTYKLKLTTDMLNSVAEELKKI